MTNTTDAKIRLAPATEVDEICYDDDGYLDATAALSELRKVVDGIVRQEAWGELQAGHDALKQTSRAHLFPAATPYHTKYLNKANKQFNRIECDSLRFTLAQLQGFYVDSKSITQLRLLARYLLNRKVGAEARCAGDYDLGAEAEGSAEAQLRGLKAANR
jgi:hypothetical protein